MSADHRCMAKPSHNREDSDTARLELMGIIAFSLVPRLLGVGKSLGTRMHSVEFLFICLRPGL